MAEALARIEAALERIDRAAARHQEQAARLAARHDRLRERVAAAMTALDALIERDG
ncbi:MAG: hypothetical protein K2X73_04025 [Sphingomonas sp.]|uniref:hypothetical protein n=1 Tax=Sphingomonas sp. TaxID=28214 RepID=UPI0025FCB2EE|nr:hypothetical protein [Sphingomonas sp.]MBX9881120.1 hypothetical protein [Sphingomonas sp.]